jgi:hypothetical protein
MTQTADDIIDSATGALQALYKQLTVEHPEDHQAFATLVLAESQLAIARAIQEQNAV